MLVVQIMEPLQILNLAGICCYQHQKIEKNGGERRTKGIRKPEKRWKNKREEEEEKWRRRYVNFKKNNDNVATLDFTDQMVV